MKNIYLILILSSVFLGCGGKSFEKIREEDLESTSEFQKFDQAAKNAIRSEDNNVKSLWATQKTKQERTLLDSQDFLISYNYRWGVMSVCTDDLLMVDLDYSDSKVGNRTGALTRLNQYAKQNSLTFAIRDSDRGIHAFLVSKKSDPKSEDSQRIMWENFGDVRYLSYAKIRGFCSRIGPKVFNIVKVGPGNVLLTQQEMNNEFISRKPKEEIIGDPSRVDKSLLKKLYMNDELVKIVRNSFQTDYSTMTSKTVNNKTGFIPDSYLKNTLLPKFKNALTNMGYAIGGAAYSLDKGNAI